MRENDEVDMQDYEKNLIARVKKGDMKAYERLIDIHICKLRTFIAYRVPAQHLVNDIAQETFVFAFENIGRFKVNGSFAAWLRSIAYNKIRALLRNYAREQSRKKDYLSELVVRSTMNDISNPMRSMIEHLESCLHELPAHLKQLVSPQYNCSASGGEIAEKMDRTSSWVQTTLYRVRKNLRKCVEGKIAQEASL